jgi:hypothetical protein
VGAAVATIGGGGKGRVIARWQELQAVATTGGRRRGRVVWKVPDSLAVAAHRPNKPQFKKPKRGGNLTYFRTVVLSLKFKARWYQSSAVLPSTHEKWYNGCIAVPNTELLSCPTSLPVLDCWDEWSKGRCV